MPGGVDHAVLICSTCQGENTPDGLCAVLQSRLPSGYVSRPAALFDKTFAPLPRLETEAAS